MRGDTKRVADPAGRGGDPSLPPEWTAPDDARELDLEVIAWRREQAAAARRHRLEVLLGRRGVRWRRSSPSVPVLLLLLGCVVGTAAALVLLLPVSVRTTPGARPLASTPAAPGRAGALLPSVSLEIGSTTRDARALRPAVLAIAPSPCRCSGALTALAAETQQYAVPLVLIVPTGDREIPQLLRTARGTRVFSAYDTVGRLASTYTARGLTALLLRSDGIVTDVVRELQPQHRFGAQLIDLTR